MYEAMGERAPLLGKMTGAMTTALVLAGAAYLAMHSLGIRFEPALLPPTILIEPAEQKEPVTAEPQERLVVDPLKLSVDLPPAPKFETFVPEGDSPIEVVVGGEPRVNIVPAPPVPVPPAPVRVWPKLRPGDLPPYPAYEIRAKGEGVSRLEVCVDARGRVTDAKVAASSGRTRLDDAAIDWIKRARFTPGTVNGSAQTMCGHSVVYEWRLEDAAR